MADHPLRDLLPIPPGVTDPNAYEVFGLRAPADDASLMKAAAEAVANLKAKQTDTPPDRWRAAAAMVQRARDTLRDPGKRAALDAAAEEPMLDDPLAGILPPARGATDPAEPRSAATPTDPPGSSLADPPPAMGPASAPPVPTTPAAVGAVSSTVDTPGTPSPLPRPTVATAERPRKKRRRKRGFPLLGCLLTSGIVSLTVVVGYLAYVLNTGGGTLTIVRDPGGVTITTGTVDPDAPPLVAPPAGSDAPLPRRKITPRRTAPRDPVMGLMAGDVPMPEATSDVDFNAADPSVEAMANSASANSALVNSAPVSKTPRDGSGPTGSSEKDDEVIDDVVALIATHQYDDAAERADSASVADPARRSLIRGLSELADLASYYRGGISRGLLSLQPASTIEVAGRSFVVVETGSESVALMADRRTRSFTLDDLPMTLAKHFAAYAIDDGPTRDLAEVAYRSVMPTTTADVREAEVQRLKAMSTLPDGIDSQSLAEAINRIPLPTER